MLEYDLVIRNGFIVDGGGAPGYEADVAITGGCIAKIGRVHASGAEEIDAKGMIVTPGFVDIHTHYDGQATWSNVIDPSSCHGVTTAVMGNCGVGFAPVREQDHDNLIRLMEGVEDIPFPVLADGLPWAWESFPDYLDFLETRKFDIDIGAQLPHAALRVYVMGQRGVDREPATEDEIALMSALAEQAVRAGALGFSTSRTLNHRASDGQPTPTLTASEAELMGIAEGVMRANAGVLQFVSDFAGGWQEVDMLKRLVARSGRPLSVSLTQTPAKPDAWRKLLSYIEDASEEGLPMRAQVCGRPVGVLLGLELTAHPFVAHPTYRAIKDLPLPERVAALRRPEVRERLLSEVALTRSQLIGELQQKYDQMYVLSEPLDYEPTPDRSVASMAYRRGIPPEEMALDIMLENEGKGMLYLTFLNYAGASLDPSYEMLSSSATLPGLSDGGAHVGMICDGSFPTSMLIHWTRDRTRGPRLTLEEIVRKQSHDTAHWVGLRDRGLLKQGYRADINVIDYDHLTLHLPEVRYDLPSGGRRLHQAASGYRATIVAGKITGREDKSTGARAGRLVRGERRSPVLP
tara:strand:- start:19190 stop:20917 length:1728 start_codon:yes stop_codon:yes gene_type:complete